MYSFRSLTYLFGVTALLASCATEADHFVGQNIQPITCLSDDSCSSDQLCDSVSRTCTTITPTKNIDVLFLVDNSPSMAPRQMALAASIPKFIQKIDATGADYHVAIATSDIGTTIGPGQFWGVSSVCDTFAGDDGLLQASACSKNPAFVWWTPEAQQACNMLCTDPKYVPTDGKRFISKVAGVTNVPSDLQPDMHGGMIDLGPQRAFQCMALVGDGGCGVEGQFEGVRRALDGHRMENSGFLRPDSVLAVIFITDEDDCSVQMARRAENDPLNTFDCPTADPNASYQCYNVDYRCMARDVVCDQPLNTAGAKTGCHERPTSYLEPVQTYVDFFSHLRPSARRLFISGIWTLPALDQGGQLTVVLRFPPGSPGLNRAKQPCGSNDPLVPGYPQIRLSKLAQSFKDTVEIDLCQVDKYPDALDTMATEILVKAGLLPSS